MTHIVHLNCGGQLVMDSALRDGKFITEYYNPRIKDHAEIIITCPYCDEPLGKIPTQQGLYQATSLRV